MNKCTVCGKECVGECCSGACRAKKSRQDRAHAHAEGRTVEAHAAQTLPDNYGLPDCECQQCQTNRVNGNKHMINHSDCKMRSEMASEELNRVTLPGDVDYLGVAA